MKVPVTVTRDHIRRGVPKDAFACALALALTDQYGGKWIVGGAIAERGLQRWRLDEPAQQIPQRFDAGQHIREQVVMMTGPALTRRGPRRRTHPATKRRFDSGAEIAVALVYSAGLGIVRAVKALWGAATRHEVTGASEAAPAPAYGIAHTESRPSEPVPQPETRPAPAPQPGSHITEPVPVRVRDRADGTERLVPAGDGNHA